MLLAAIVPVFFSYSLMNRLHGLLGLGELPQTVIVDYLTRSVSMIYVLHGAICFFLTFDLRRYLPLIRFIAVMHFLFGWMVFGIDLVAKLPLFWTIGEGPMVALFGTFIFFYAGSCQAEIEQAKPTETAAKS